MKQVRRERLKAPVITGVVSPSLRQGFSRNPEGFDCHRGMMLSRDPVFVVRAILCDRPFFVPVSDIVVR